jgi:drug/metabolite transporter (DMT)-like permease
VPIYTVCIYSASLTQWLFFVGLRYTTATFACAFINMTPMFTFLVALPFRMEKLDLKTGAGVAKVIGTAVGFSGAVTLALYQGPSLTKPQQQPSAAAMGGHGGAGAHRWVTGSLSLLAGAACWSFWFILQSRLGKKYPALYSGNALMFLLSFLQMAAVGLATQRDLSVWILRTKLQIITVLFVVIKYMIDMTADFLVFFLDVQRKELHYVCTVSQQLPKH